MRGTLKLLLTGVLVLALLACATSASAHGRKHHHHRSHPALSTANCANADTAASAATRDAMRAAVVCLINFERTSRGLPALSVDSRLDHAAQLWTQVVVTTGQLSHGSDFASRLTAAGFSWLYAGENIAAGYQTPRQAVAAWMASPDHCHNVLDPHYADVGTGVATQPFANFGSGTWTQDFGLLQGHRIPSGNSGPQSGCPY